MQAEAIAIAIAAAPAIGAGTLLRDVLASRVPRAHAARAQLVELRRRALAEVGERDLLQPAARWRFMPLAAAPTADGLLSFGGVRLLAPRLLPASGRLCAVALAVATIGAALEQRVRDLFARRQAAQAVALDGVGNELLFALSRRLQDGMHRAARGQDLTLAGELRAGDPGLALQAQAPLLELADAAAIGVSLTRTLMMQPTKSTSMLLGLGHDLPAQTWSRCDECRSRARCAVANDRP